MNILVTGGAGYIGSATAEALVRGGHAVTVYDSLVTGHQKAVPAEATFVQADLSDSHALIETLTREKFHAVMHFAASIEAGVSLIGCQMTVDLFGFTHDDFIPEVKEWVGAATFLPMARDADVSLFI